MQIIGQIQQVQVQRSSLKIRHNMQQYYNPAPLQVVPQLLLTPTGVIGIDDSGYQIMDVHNAAHPYSKFREENGICLGFSSHYREMRARFGTHILDGIGGENIFITATQIFSPADLRHGLQIESQVTHEIIYLTEIEPAPPCVAFSHFALQGGDVSAPQPDNKLVKETLQFLHYGMRGFYATLAAGQKNALIQAGDIVFAL